MDGTVEIACCFDRRFAVGAAVLAASILANAQPGRRYRLHAIYDSPHDLAPDVFAPFAGTALEVRAERITNEFAAVRTSRRTLSAAAYVRLALPELLPDVDRVLYLDADALCLADVGELFDTPLGDAAIAASLDAPMVNIIAMEEAHGTAQNPRSHTAYLETVLGLGEHKRRYFNSGVLVLDLARLRRDRFTERARAFIAAHEDAIRYDDQCVLNALCATEYRLLSARWNAMLCPPRWEFFVWAGVDVMRRVADAFAHPAILHYCQETKPWIRRCHETTWAPVWRSYALAAPLPARMRRALYLSGIRQLARFLRPSVQAKAEPIRAELERRGVRYPTPAR